MTDEAVRAALGNAAIVRPGDTLVVGLPDEDDEDGSHLLEVKSEIESYLPGIKVVIVVGATSLATYRPRYVLGAEHDGDQEQVAG